MNGSEDEERLVASALASLLAAGETYDVEVVRQGVRQLLDFARLSDTVSGEQAAERFAIFEIFAPHVVRGATTWLEIFVSMSDDDRANVDALLKGRKLAQVLAWKDDDYETLETD